MKPDPKGSLEYFSATSAPSNGHANGDAKKRAAEIVNGANGDSKRMRVD